VHSVTSLLQRWEGELFPPPYIDTLLFVFNKKGE
jgi:hypothetical protein